MLTDSSISSGMHMFASSLTLGSMPLFDFRAFSHFVLAKRIDLAPVNLSSKTHCDGVLAVNPSAFLFAYYMSQH